MHLSHQPIDHDVGMSYIILLVGTRDGRTQSARACLLPTVLRDSLLLLLPPCFYITKCNKHECCYIWLSGPRFQDLDIWLSGLGFQDLDKRTLGFSTSIDARTHAC
jgi:hypothetical protein